MEATMAYQAGKPIVTDEEFDQLRRELRNKNSIVVQQVWSLCILNGHALHNAAVDHTDAPRGSWPWP